MASPLPLPAGTNVSEASLLTAGQIQALIVTERVNAVASILSIIFVVATYLFLPGFNKPINRLIFFASFGNLGSAVAALISENGPLAGESSALCKIQAFLVQMFLGVDCYWTLCMAVNVYLVFFRGYTIDQLRSLDLAYLLICYGLSFIPAFVFIFINTNARGPIYGPAVIWCWINIEWDFMRFLFLYAIVWVAIILAMAIYGAAAKLIWDKRELLDGFLNPLNENPFINTVTTEVTITTEERPIVENSKYNHETVRTVEESATPGVDNPYSVNIQVNQQTNIIRPFSSALRMRSLTRQIAKHETNAEAWLYARAAFLFFIALLITWIPSSANRIYASMYPDATNFGLNYAASFVFPLQAFWNTIVYIITSQSACRDLFRFSSSSSPSISRKSAPSPSPSQVKLTQQLQNHIGRPRRSDSNEQMEISSSADSVSKVLDEQELQTLERSRWSNESTDRRRLGR
ncbi:hypothetical protein EYB26_005501 [Talaromyces marneffei]|uniref:uncharacterized protein n=1 Tax=Talaromyces marneffei TaxID=37727 RepID=UPI0012A9C839|nr:uncharacterized protein EYB26_005501 [Talaromyces marneffei]QGA17825.1 hypothetical protein EYB26_005501 [Talaromyces marneffei]